MAAQIQLIGFIAGALVLVSFVPQVMKSWKTKKTGDLSLVMYVCMIAGLCLWLIYGILLRDMPIITANGLALLLALSILILKIRHG